MNYSRRNICRRIKAAKISGLIWGFLFGLAFGLMPWLYSVATAQRGYYAIGGEALVWMIPLLAYWLYGSMKDFAKGVNCYEEMQ